MPGYVVGTPLLLFLIFVPCVPVRACCRALLYYRILSKAPREASEIIAGSRPPVAAFLEDVTDIRKVGPAVFFRRSCRWAFTVEHDACMLALLLAVGLGGGGGGAPPA
jgi:hypothetical protein